VGFKLLSDEELIQQFELISPNVMLRAARLQLLARIVAKNVHIILSAINFIVCNCSSSCGWVAAIECDLKWLELGGKYHFSSILNSIEQIKGDPKKFQTHIRAYAASRFANLDVPKALPQYSSSVNFSSFHCTVCSKVFHTKQKLALHNFKVHNIKDPIRLYINTVHCPICMLYFHTRERLLNHVKFRSSVCKTNILLGGAILSEAQADSIDVQLQAENRALQVAGHRRHFAKDPVFRLPGPIANIVCPKPSAHHPLGIGRNYHY